MNKSELYGLLNNRLANLLGKLRRSLLLNGLVAGLSLLFAAIIHRQIVRPLRQLEELAENVRKTKDYSLRINLARRDEIGQLATAFNAMLAELATAREREAADQAATRRARRRARVARLTTMGEMAASIAHEINQPLAAVVNNANAGLRLLKREPPRLAQSITETPDAVSIACFPLRRCERGHFGAFGELGHPFVADAVRSWPSSRSTAWLTHRYRHRSTAMLPSSSIGSSRPLSLPRPESCAPLAGAQRSFLCKEERVSGGHPSRRKRAHSPLELTNAWCIDMFRPTCKRAEIVSTTSARLIRQVFRRPATDRLLAAHFRDRPVTLTES